MTEILGILYKLRIFTSDELSGALKGKVKAVEAFCLLGTSNKGVDCGWQGANTYCTEGYWWLFYLFATRYGFSWKPLLSPTACISYQHIPLEFQFLIGLTQPFNEVFVEKHDSLQFLSFDDVDYTYCRQTKRNRWYDDTPSGKPYVRVTDVERVMLLDCFDRIDRAGGIDCCIVWEGIVLFIEERLIDYLARYDRRHSCTEDRLSVWRRIKGTSQHLQNPSWSCASQGTKSVKWLTNNEESDTFVNKWRMYVPQELTSKEEYELI